MKKDLNRLKLEMFAASRLYKICGPEDAPHLLLRDMAAEYRYYAAYVTEKFGGDWEDSLESASPYLNGVIQALRGQLSGAMSMKREMERKYEERR